MNQLSDKDLEFAKKHATYYQHASRGIEVFPGDVIFTQEELAAYNAERDAEQQHNAEAVAIYIGDAAGSTSEYGRIQYLVHQGQPLKAGDELFTHAPSLSALEYLLEWQKELLEIDRPSQHEIDLKEEIYDRIIELQNKKGED